MLISKVFGKDSHYMEDLGAIHFPHYNEPLAGDDSTWKRCQSQFVDLCHIFDLPNELEGVADLENVIINQRIVPSIDF